MAREKTLKVIFTFKTTTQAMQMEQCAREADAVGRLIPVPRQISAGCGMAWSAPVEAGESLKALLKEKGIEIQGVYELLM